MRRILFSIAIVVLGASGAHAQLNPPRWTLGIFDDAAMTLTQGRMAGPTKEIYVGARAELLPGDGFLGFEFGVAGLEPFAILAADWTPPTSMVIGNIAAPADTVSGVGGLNVAWPFCVPPDVAFLRLVVASPTPPQNHVLYITRRFPPSGPERPFPYGVSCDACGFCWNRVHTSAYTLNPSIAVERVGWAAIKQLYL